MIIRAYSDIHLDHYFDGSIPRDVHGKIIAWYPPSLPDDANTTLVLAGDLWKGTKFIEYMGYSWISDVASMFKDVVIVLGNHDYWPCKNTLTIKDGAEKARELLRSKNINNVHLLDMNTFELGGDFLFVGATLWTDLNKEDPLVMFGLSTTMFNDSKINYENCHGQLRESKLTALKWLHTHRKHCEYIRLIANQNPHKKIVVVTHHAPLYHVLNPSFSRGFSNAYYGSNLSDLILDSPNIVAWIFGHSHHRVDEMFGNCRMINHPVGYRGEHSEKQINVLHDIIDL